MWKICLHVLKTILILFRQIEKTNFIYFFGVDVISTKDELGAKVRWELIYPYLKTMYEGKITAHYSSVKK